MALVINLYGGPGTGKSTTASGVFNLLKKAGYNAEYVSEYVKQWAWEERNIVNEDQFYFFGKQARREYSLFKNCDVIITDSPVSICAYYAELYGTKAQADVFKEMTKVYYNMVNNGKNEYLHVWLNRVKPYNPKGRFQSADEALQIDINMKRLIEGDLQLPLHYFDGNENGEEQIVEMVKNHIMGSL